MEQIGKKRAEILQQGVQLAQQLAIIDAQRQELSDAVARLQGWREALDWMLAQQNNVDKISPKE